MLLPEIPRSFQNSHAPTSDVNIPILLDGSAKVKAWDPVGEKNFKKLYPTEITYCTSIDDAVRDADLCFIFTEWQPIREYDVANFARLMKKPLVLDGRNCYDTAECKKAGVLYESIGR